MNRPNKKDYEWDFEEYFKSLEKYCDELEKYCDELEKMNSNQRDTIAQLLEKNETLAEYNGVNRGTLHLSTFIRKTSSERIAKLEKELDKALLALSLAKEYCVGDCSRCPLDNGSKHCSNFNKEQWKEWCMSDE